MRRLEALVERDGVADRFVWTPILVDSAAVLNAIDVLAHACDIEGFGRVTVEAMAAGRPVVGTATGGLAKIVDSGKTGS